MRAERANQNEWNFTVQGQSGNNYLVTASRDKLKCRCMDCAIRRRTCKHLLFIVAKIAMSDKLLNSMTTNLQLNVKKHSFFLYFLQFSLYYLVFFRISSMISWIWLWFRGCRRDWMGRRDRRKTRRELKRKMVKIKLILGMILIVLFVLMIWEMKNWISVKMGVKSIFIKSV